MNNLLLKRRKSDKFCFIYDYIFGQNFSYPSFKVLYESMGREKDDSEKLKKCLYDFLNELRRLKQGDDDLGQIVEETFSKDINNVVEKKCKLIESCMARPSWFDNSCGNATDKHVFYKIRLCQRLAIELEDYKPARLDEPLQKGQAIHFFKDEKINHIIDFFNYNPDNISVFVLRQIEHGVGDNIFREIYNSLEKSMRLHF
jgi:hypothetical protein